MPPARLSTPAVIFLAALALRAAWVLLNWWRTGASLSYDDEALHWQLATNLVERFTLVSDDGRYAARMPVYPLFLALFAWLGEVGVLAARLAQCLCSAGSAVLVYAIARQAVATRGALLAGGLATINPYAIFFSNLLLTETLFSLLALGFVGLLMQLAHTARGRSDAAALGAALLAVLLVLTRPSAAGWSVLALALLPWFARSWRRAAKVWGWSAAAALILFGLWGWRNTSVIGGPALLSSNGGVTLYDALGPQADGSSDQAFLQDLPPKIRALPELARDDYLRDRALEHIQAHPQRVAELALVKLLRTWNPFPNVAEYRQGAAAWAGAVFTITVVLLALGGLLRALRARQALRLHTALWLPIVYFTFVHMIYIGSVRYRVPLMPLLCTGAAAIVSVNRPPRSGQR